MACIPVRCYSCGKVLSSFEERYRARRLDGETPERIFDSLGITRLCCRIPFRTMLHIGTNAEVAQTFTRVFVTPAQEKVPIEDRPPFFVMQRNSTLTSEAAVGPYHGGTRLLRTDLGNPFCSTDATHPQSPASVGV